MTSEPYLAAQYEMPWRDDIDRYAERIAVGMTVGSWTDVPDVRKPHLARYLGEVGSVERHGERARVTIRYPEANVRPSVAAILTVVFGKLSLDGAIRLVGLDLPSTLLARFPGPRFGIAGLRERLAVFSRPLVMSIFKSENGRSLAEFRAAFDEQVRGGVDFVKDDEIFLADDAAPLRDRIRTAEDLLQAREAKTGQRGLYFPNLAGTPSEVLDLAGEAKRAGASGLLLEPFASGMDVLTDLRRAQIDLPLLVHPAFSGAVVSAPAHGVHPAIWLGLMPRLAGGDLVLFPSPYGSVAMLRPDSLRVAEVLRAPGPHRPVLPGPSAGIHVGLVPTLVRDFGRDLVVNAGGAVHGHPGGTEAGARALMEAVQAAAGTSAP